MSFWTARYFWLFPFGILAFGCGTRTSGSAQSPSAQSAAVEPRPQQREALRAEEVLFALRGSENDFRKCFMRAMDERGLVETSFELSERGEVEDVEVVRSTLGREDVKACVRERMMSQLFGPQAGPRNGRWTFVFRLSDPIPEGRFKARLRAARTSGPKDGVRIDPSSEGQLELSAIEQRIQVKYPLFARCYRLSIGRRGHSEGVLRLKLALDARGRVVEVQDAGSVMPDPFAVDCIAEGFYAMEFPAPAGGPALVHYRLDFE